MGVRVGDQLPVEPRNAILVDLLDVILHIGDLAGSVEASPFLDDQPLTGVSGGGESVGKVAVVGAARDWRVRLATWTRRSDRSLGIVMDRHHVDRAVGLEEPSYNQPKKCLKRF